MLAIPNFSEGTHPDRIDAIGQALRSVPGVHLLDVHSDPDHDRSVYTLADPAAVVAATGQRASGSARSPFQNDRAPGCGRGHGAGCPPVPTPIPPVLALGTGEPQLGPRRPRSHADSETGSDTPAPLVDALFAGAQRAIELLDITRHHGSHPRIGMLDVAPMVYMDDADRGAACAQALTLADRLGSELEIPVFLYGVLTEGRVTRAAIRRGGPANLQARIDAGELRPDFGPHRLHPRAGGVLVAARPPLIAFNVELAPPATLDDAKRIAALVREGGAEGLPAVRAIGLTLPHREDVAQVSTNVEDYRQTSLATLVAAIARHATPVRAEVVGLPPRAAFGGFPADLPVTGRRYLEDALSAVGVSVSS